MIDSPQPSPDTRDGAGDRAYSVQILTSLADPILTALSENKLKSTIPGNHIRQHNVPMEAFCRLIGGMAPWLELPPDESTEGKLRAHYIALAVESIANAVDPDGPDFMPFDANGGHGQPLVEGAYLALAVLRAPRQLWGNLSESQKQNLILALKSTRSVEAPLCNWLLFSASVEAALWMLTGECEIAPVEKAVTMHLQWYKGDGVYGDGPQFHWDYYNSYVIQPMLLAVLRVCEEKQHPLASHLPLALERAQRYAVIQERFISPEGTYPVIGRSSTYRFAAFQTLADLALTHQLPAGLEPAVVRSALTAVIRRVMDAPGTFDVSGWLQPGAVGHQPSLRERYISTGSPYICTAGLLQLGLPPDDAFWTGGDRAWTQKRIWAGLDEPADHDIPN